ncbi:MAG: hypothetical protein LBC68_13820 [Prevotellaceae bacterium]|jgi:hypothetical protein|nr:hypothetical protein [Prevotellaceae bacterium]
MENIMYIELTNPEAANLLLDMEALNLIKVLKKPPIKAQSHQKLSDKYEKKQWQQAAIHAHFVGDDKLLIENRNENIDWWTWAE